MKKKEKTKTVKAWAIIGVRGKLMSAELDLFCTYRDRVSAEWDSGAEERVVPCTITYNVPERKR